MNRIRTIISFFAITLFSMASFAAEKDIVIENRLMKLTLSSEGFAKSLICKGTGEECLETDAGIPLCSVVQHRPYDNENFLMFPAKPRIFPSNRISVSGDTLFVEFRDTYDIAVIKLDIADEYIGFSLVRRDYRIEDYGVKRKTEIDEFALLQLPVTRRERFGEWLNVTWDDRTAVGVLGTDPATRIDAKENGDRLEMYAGLDNTIKLFGSGAILVASSTDKFLDCIAELEKDYGMPSGVESRRRPEYKFSYYELRDFDLGNIDEHIAYAKEGGFRTVVIYYMDFAKSCGHYLWNDRFPEGLENLKEITGRISQAGLIPGFHIHYSKVSVTDPYINSGIPDARINHVNPMLLSRNLDKDDTEIYVEHIPQGLRLEDGRRLLHIGDELIAFGDISATPPFKLTGCERGMYGSTASEHAKGTRFSQADVDDWPLFIRIDQNTSLQKEIAGKLAEIYSECGFRFIYFDGAEDVPAPYWYNVSKSQKTVYDALSPAPIFSEGALKSHYGWHILTRGNAFDLFPPEKIRQAMKKYTLRCAERISDDFTSVNFGWVDYVSPTEESAGMQPDTYEYICSKALAWDSPISLVAKIDQIRIHPRRSDIFEVISMWENAKIDGIFNRDTKEKLKDPEKEFIILPEKHKGFEIYEYFPVTSEDNRTIRAFRFTRNGKNCLIYWGISGDGELRIRTGKTKISLTDTHGEKIGYAAGKEWSTVPFGKRMIMETDMSAEELEKMIAECESQNN